MAILSNIFKLLSKISYGDKMAHDKNNEIEIYELKDIVAKITGKKKIRKNAQVEGCKV